MGGMISICICTYRRKLLERTLSSLQRLVVPRGTDIEVVVVDNDAEGSARTLVERFRNAVAFSVRYEIEPRKGLSFARNRALDLAQGDWLALIDDDERAAPDWLQKLMQCAEQYRANAVVGGVWPEFEQPPQSWLVNSRFFDWWLPPTGTRIGMGEALSGNALLDANFLRAQGLRFDVTFNSTGGEDSDFFRRLIDHGGHVVSSREAMVHEFVPRERMTPQYLVGRSLRVGEVYARVSHLHGGPFKLALDCARAAFNVLAAGVLALVNLPRGGGAYYRYYLLLVRNAGKFRYYLGVRPLEMYK